MGGVAAVDCADELVVESRNAAPASTKLQASLRRVLDAGAKWFERK
jgi:hypothetical protein